MIADYFTKPLQGSAFRKMVKVIMNISDNVIDTLPQECVGKARLNPTRLDPKNQVTARPDEVAERAPSVEKKTGGCHIESMSNGRKIYADVVRA